MFGLDSAPDRCQSALFTRVEQLPTLPRWNLDGRLFLAPRTLLPTGFLLAVPGPILYPLGFLSREPAVCSGLQTTPENSLDFSVPPSLTLLGAANDPHGLWAPCDELIQASFLLSQADLDPCGS